MCIIKGETKNFEFKEENEKKVKIGHKKLIKEKKDIIIFFFSL